MLSVLERIHEAILSSGELPEDFSIQNNAENQKIGFVDGARDGIFIYHFGGVSPKCRDFELALQAANTRDFKRAKALLQMAFADEDITMLSQVDYMANWIKENAEQIDAEAVYAFARQLLFTSDSVEIVKCALSIMEYVFADKDEECKAAIRELGLSDEMALFVLWAIGDWKQANEEVFHMAQKLHGWGRIHAVECLEPETLEIKEWLLQEGINNEVMPEYSALTVANKVELLSVIRSCDVSSQKFLSASKILQAMILSEGGPVAGISDYAEQEVLISEFLAKVTGVSLGDAVYEIMETVRQYDG